MSRLSSSSAPTRPSDADSPSGRSRPYVWNSVGLVVRLLLAAVFFVSGILKAGDPRETKFAVRAYQLLPDSVSDLVAAVLPYLEIATGVILLLGLATRLGALLSALMMIAFLIGVISAAARGLTIDCGCFGGGGAVAPGETAYTEEILRDTGLLIVSVYLLLRPRSWLAIDNLAHRGDRDDDYDSADGSDDGEDEHDGVVDAAPATGSVGTDEA